MPRRHSNGDTGRGRLQETLPVRSDLIVGHRHAEACRHPMQQTQVRQAQELGARVRLDLGCRRGSQRQHWTASELGR